MLNREATVFVMKNWISHIIGAGPLLAAFVRKSRSTA